MIRYLFIIGFLFLSLAGFSQKERDTTVSRCPVFIVDTVSGNNFFLSHLPATIRVYRVKGDLTIAVEQRDQFFTLFFGKKKLENKKYNIASNPSSKKAVAAKYSFKSGGQVSYVTISNGTVETSFNKETGYWHIKVNGLLANLVGTSVTFFKVTADLYIH
jgi:hypothetical protein